MLHSGPPASMAVGRDQALWLERCMTSPPAWVHRIKEDAYINNTHTRTHKQNATTNSSNSALLGALGRKQVLRKTL